MTLPDSAAMKARDWMAIVHAFNKYKLVDNSDQQVMLHREFITLFEAFIADYPNPFSSLEKKLSGVPLSATATINDEQHLLACDEDDINVIEKKLKKLFKSKSEIESYIKLGELELKLFSHSDTPVVDDDKYRHIAKIEKLQQLLNHTNKKIKAFTSKREELIASS